MSERARQWQFAMFTADLFTWARNQGYRWRYGEAWRTPEQAAWNEMKGLGIHDSLHCDRLALDLLFAKDGVDLIHAPDVAPIGAFWKSLDPDCRWGGDFPRLDIWHFSLAFDGRA